MTKKRFRLFEITFLRAGWCSQFVRELCYAVRQGYSAAARPLHTGLPGIYSHTTGPYLFDRASWWMATWSRLRGLRQDSMAPLGARPCCGGVEMAQRIKWAVN